MPAMFLFRVFLICCFFLIPLQIWAGASCAAIFLELHIDLKLSLNTSKILYTAGIRSVKDLQSKTEEELRKLFNSNEQALQEIKVALKREKDQGLFPLHTVRTLNEMGVYAIDSLNLPTELVKVLYTAGIRSVGDLQSKTEKELRKLFNPGKKEQALQKINTAIKKKSASSSVSDLDLSESATNMLDVSRIYSTEDLIKRTERELLILLSYAGPHNHPSLTNDPKLVLREIKLALKKRGFRLSDDFLVKDMGLSVRVANALNTVVGIHTMEDLASKTERELRRLLKPYAPELFSHYFYGEQETFNVIKTALAERGLSFKSDPLVEDLGLSIITANELNRAGIHTIEDLTSKTARELSKLGISSQNLDKIKIALGYRDLSLTPDPLVDDLGFSVKTANILDKAGIHTIEDVTGKTDRELKKLLRPYVSITTIYSITRGIIPKIKTALAEKGLSLKSDLLVDDLGLTFSAANELNRAGIHTIKDLTTKTARELLNISGISNRSLFQIRKALEERGLSFKSDLLVDDLGLAFITANELNRAGIHTIEDLTKKTGRELSNISGISNRSLFQIRRTLAKRGSSLKFGLLVDDLGLAFITANELNEAGIHTIEDLTKKTGRELLNINGIGNQKFAQIRKALEERGLSFKSDPWVDDLDLSVRIANNLDRAGIHSIEDLTKKTARELLNINGIGNQKFAQIRKALEERDLSFKPDPLVDDLGLSIKTANTLAGIHTIEDLTTKTERELFNTAGISSESFVQIRRELAERGLSFKSDLLVDDLGLSVRIANNLDRAGIHTIENLTKKNRKRTVKY